MVNDIIADMITCIRNANLRKSKTVEITATNSTIRISKILFQEGFIQNVRERQEDNRKCLVLTLKYEGRKQKPYITTLKRISKPGLRVYSSYQEIPKILGGMGIVIISTSRGIMIDRDARKNKLGGEILCYVW